MPLNIYLGTYVYHTDTCPRVARTRCLFTAAADRATAQALFRRFIRSQSDYRELLGIHHETVLEPLSQPARYSGIEARKFVEQLLHFHFEYVDHERLIPPSIEDRVAALVAP